MGNWHYMNHEPQNLNCLVFAARAELKDHEAAKISFCLWETLGFSRAGANNACGIQPKEARPARDVACFWRTAGRVCYGSYGVLRSCMACCA